MAAYIESVAVTPRRRGLSSRGQKAAPGKRLFWSGGWPRRPLCARAHVSMVRARPRLHRERERRGEPGGKQVRSDLSVSWLSGGLFQRQIVLRAAPSFGQPRPIIPWAALAGHIGLGFRIGANEGALTVCRATRQRRRSKCSSSVYSASAPGCAGQGCGALRRSDAALGCGSDAAARQRGACRRHAGEA